MELLEVLNPIENLKKQLESCLQHKSRRHPESRCKFIGFINPQDDKPFQFFLKRFIDITGTCVGLILIFPILVAIAAAIKLESKGPVIFRQKRVGSGGREFYMYKFRSMYMDAEERLKEIQSLNQTNEYMFKMFDDPRVTKVGNFLRKYSLDELPQLINVLRGEMTLVGFRPPITDEVKKYKDWHYLRFSGLPGLTGPWQVNGRSSIKDFDIVVKLEYEYIKNWNILKDIIILLKTVPVVFLGKDAA